MADTEKKVIIRATFDDNASSKVKSMGENIQNSTNKSTNSVNLLTKAMKLLASAFVVKKVYDFGKAIVTNTSELEQNTVAFTAMLGSAERASKLLFDLAQFAKQTPFELTDLQAYTRQLLAYGFAIEDLIPTLKTVGNISAGLGSESLPAIIRALGQIKAKGKLAGSELLQLTETGLPITEVLGKKLGISASSVAENVSKLGISYRQVLEAIQEIEKNQFDNLMEKQSATLQGIWSNILDTFKNLTTEIGKQSGLFDLVKNISQGFLGLLEQNSQTIINLFAGIKDSILGIIALLPEITNEEIVNWINDKIITPIKDFYENILKPLFAFWKEQIEAQIIPSLQKLWESLKTLFDFNEEEIAIIKDILTNIVKIIGIMIVGAITIVIFTIGKVVDVITEVIKKTTELRDNAKQTWDNIIDWIANAILKFREVKKSIEDIITKIKEATKPIDFRIFSTNTSNRATGGMASGWTMTGESGRELVKLPQGSHVYNNEDTNKMLGGNSIEVNINAPVYGVDNFKASIIEAVNIATAKQNRLANYNLL